MKLIKDWSKLTLICYDCKTLKSVKYEDDNKTYCNLCMAKKRIKQIKEDGKTKNNVV